MTTKIPVELSSTPGIVDGSNATAITISSAEKVTFAKDIEIQGDSVSGSEGGHITLRAASGGSKEFGIDVDSSNNLRFITEDDGTGDNGAAHLYLTNTGNVGIGTSSPSSIFHVVAEGNNGQRVHVGTSSAHQIYLGNTGGVSSVGTLSNHNFQIITNGASRLLVDSSGNVTLGSGTNVGTAGTITMNVGSTSSGGGLQLFAPTGAAHGINFGDAYSTSAVYAGAIEYNHASNYMRFFTGSSERMRIDSSGNVGIGNSIPSSFFAGASSLVAGDGSGDDGITIYSGNASLGRIHFADGTSGDAVYAGFIAYNHADNDMLLGGRGSGTTIMTLEANGSVGAPSGTNIYNASDRRVKQNITTLSDSLTIVKALNPVKFNWIEDFSKSENDKTLYGFVAQEVQTVFPDAVESFASGQPIKAGDVTVDNPLAVREKFLIPVLVKAIQEQQEQIEQLKTEIQTLKGE